MAADVASPSAPRVVREAGAILRARTDEFARLMTEEMGKTLDDGRAEVEKCAFHCDWFADHAEGYLADEPVDIGGPEAFVTFNPLGVVLAVMPWNFPFWQVFRFAAPALMAGNGALLKHASNVPGCALAIEEVLHEAGVPSDLFRTLLLPSSEVKALIEDENVAAVTLTGQRRRRAQRRHRRRRRCSRNACSSSAARTLTSSSRTPTSPRRRRSRRPRAWSTAARAASPASASSSSARSSNRSSRRWSRRCVASRWAIPRMEGTKLGPMQSVEARDHIHQQVRRASPRARGCCSAAKCPTGRAPGIRRRCWPTSAQGQPAHDEEVFGPVAAIIAADDEADAIRIANASEFGLGSGVLTGDLDRGRRIAAEELEAGMSFVNENVRSDPRMPFGGVKHSGYGRECAAYGIREFTNIKSVHVKPLEGAGGSKVE